MLITHNSEKQVAASLPSRSLATKVSLGALMQLECHCIPVARELVLRVEPGKDGLPTELSSEEISASLGVLGKRYHEVWGSLPRDEKFQLLNGSTVMNGRAVGCLDVTIEKGALSATMKGIPYFLLLAAKELKQGKALLKDAPPVSLEESFAFGASGQGPGIAGGSVAAIVIHNGRRYLVGQIKGDKVVDGGAVHPFAFGGGLNQAEMHLGLVQLELGTWREFLQEGGSSEIYQISRTIGIVNEGNPAEFRSFNHALQHKSGEPITLEQFIDTVMVPYTLKRFPERDPSELEVRGWHIIDIDNPCFHNTHDGILSEGISYYIDKDPMTGGRVLRETLETRKLVEPVGGIMAEILVPGSGYRELLLEEAGVS